jgi:hypothetical protein
MAQDFLDAEERRRISMALSVREETAARFAKLRSELLAIFRSTFRKPSGRKPSGRKSATSPASH